MRLAALIQREQRRHEGERQEHCKRDCDPEKSPLASSRLLELALTRGSSGVEELALVGGEPLLAAVGPLRRRGKPCTAVEQSRIPVVAVPLARVVSEAAMELQALAILVEPAAEQGPLADQRFM